ncbi:MAG: aldehyde dehydrogenase family protein [Candidatus Limnocylindrales bacterium]|nr:aldehyde dehydrogenase family protein [Candidatus Limnocylindrales bacterium]
MATATNLVPHKIFLAGRWVDSPDLMTIANPARPGEPAGFTYQATPEQYEEAVEAAVAAFGVTRKLPAYERAATLRNISSGIRARREELGRLIALEAGKPIRDALVEVDRATLTFRLGAEEAERLGGEVIPLDLMASSRGRVGITRRYAAGPVAAISPFNFPLNLAAHKLAPAIAAGCSIVLKPPSKDPLTMLTVAEIVEEAGAPAGSVSILPMSRALGDRLVADDRFAVLSFTGSPAVGWPMKARAGKKRVVLELGGNAGAIVDRSADLDWAVRRITVGAFSYSGQVCISVQRVFVHDDVFDEFADRLVAAARALRLGDPLDPETDLGPMVDVRAAARTQAWVDEAVAAGARLLLGGHAEDTFYPPTILVDAPLDAKVCSEEAFAPLVVLARFSDFEAAVSQANDSRFGLQAGVFTNDLGDAFRAFDGLEVGGVILNDIPTYRIDHMPYGGVKDSGHGREGLRYAIEDMTEIRILVVAQPG